jgi:hypothetical protein
MGPQDFITQLRALGHEVAEKDNNRIVFPYTVPVGKYEGQTLTLGFVVPSDFPATPPSGPHVSPRVLPLNSQGDHPGGRIHKSDQFGEGWEYWSRPFPGWKNTDRTAREYMAFIRKLFLTQ